MHQFCPSQLLQWIQSCPCLLQLHRMLMHKLPPSLVIATQSQPIIILLAMTQSSSDYQNKFCKNNTDSIVTQKGKISNDTFLDRSWMRPSINKWYHVGNLHLYNVTTTMIYLSNLRLVSKDFANIIPKVLRWLWINFTLLHEPRLGYEGQELIGPHRVKMASTAMIYCGLDPRKFVCFLSGEYTGQYRDVRRTLDAVRDHVTLDD